VRGASRDSSADNSPIKSIVDPKDLKLAQRSSVERLAEPRSKKSKHQPKLQEEDDYMEETFENDDEPIPLINSPKNKKGA